MESVVKEAEEEEKGERKIEKYIVY